MQAQNCRFLWLAERAKLPQLCNLAVVFSHVRRPSSPAPRCTVSVLAEYYIWQRMNAEKGDWRTETTWLPAR